MASKNRLDQAAGASIGGFFTKADENENKPGQTAKDSEPKQSRKTYTDAQFDEALKIVYRTGKQQDGADFLNMNKGTFSKKIREIEEKEPERVKRLKEEAGQTAPQPTQEPQTATEPPQADNSTPTEEKGEEKPNTKPQKQVFSFRATLDDITDWKAYSTATGEKMENIGTAAMNEYISNHPLTGAEKAVFEAMKARNEK